MMRRVTLLVDDEALQRYWLRPRRSIKDIFDLGIPLTGNLSEVSKIIGSYNKAGIKCEDVEFIKDDNEIDLVKDAQRVLKEETEGRAIHTTLERAARLARAYLALREASLIVRYATHSSTGGTVASTREIK